LPPGPVYFKVMFAPGTGGSIETETVTEPPSSRSLEESEQEREVSRTFQPHHSPTKYILESSAEKTAQWARKPGGKIPEVRSVTPPLSAFIR